MAQRAAVVGRTFWDGPLAEVPGVEDLDAALQTLRRREFVVERVSSSIAGQTEFTFKHVLLHDVAYESLPRRDRGRAHAEAAAWIERTSGERSGELAELLAHHYDAAYGYVPDEEVRAKARGQLLAAAGNAHRRFAIEQGERFAQRAVELSEGAAERVEALEALGDLQYIAFHGDAAWRTYCDALREMDDRDLAYARAAGKAALLGGALDRDHARPAVDRRGRPRDRRRSRRGSGVRSRTHDPPGRPRVPAPPARAPSRRGDRGRGARRRRGRRGARRPEPPLGRARPPPELGHGPRPVRRRLPHERPAGRARSPHDRREGDRRHLRRRRLDRAAPRPLPRGRGACDRVHRPLARRRLGLVPPRARLARDRALHAR